MFDDARKKSCVNIMAHLRVLMVPMECSAPDATVTSDASVIPPAVVSASHPLRFGTIAAAQPAGPYSGVIYIDLDC